jgi:hypothetical protein
VIHRRRWPTNKKRIRERLKGCDIDACVDSSHVPLHVRPEDDVVVILVLKSVARVIFSRYVTLLRGHVLLPIPIVTGAVRILVLRTLKISNESAYEPMKWVYTTSQVEFHAVAIVFFLSHLGTKVKGTLCCWHCREIR